MGLTERLRIGNDCVFASYIAVITHPYGFQGANSPQWAGDTRVTVTGIINGIFFCSCSPAHSEPQVKTKRIENQWTMIPV